MTIPEMEHESHMMQKKRHSNTIRMALKKGKLKGKKELIDEKWVWTAEKQDFIEWLERSRK